MLGQRLRPVNVGRAEFLDRQDGEDDEELKRCAMAKGGSEPLGASAWRAGTFMKD